MARPLFDLTDDEVKAELRRKAEHVGFAYNDLQAELDRRTDRQRARASLILSVVGLLIAVGAAVLAALKA